MKKFLALPLFLSVAACSTANDVAINSAYQRSAAQAEVARMEAISQIAKQGQGGVVAAAMLMQQSNGTTRKAPVNSGDRVAGIISAIAPIVVGVGQIGATVYAADANRAVAVTQSNNNRDVAINQSDNDATVSMHTNDTMANIAEVTIVSPEVVTSTNTSTTTNVVCVSDATYTCE